ncbi:MAG: monovalent cation/H(+) antiporter subunit G [Gemmatimonadetes bacterium]|nr:monovalent cation/H(+) antiporter subunit G [Gemmatimonadota bacterium]
MIEAAGGVLIVGGAVFAVTGGIGMLRLPDFYSRVHAAGVTDTLGAGLILIGLMLLSPGWLVTVKLIGALSFLWIAGPTASHALANAALLSGLDPRRVSSGPGPADDGEEGDT